MFDKEHIRIYIFIAWVLAFIGLCSLLQFGLPEDSLIKKINNLQANIKKTNWKAANENIQEIKNEWEKNKIIIQINNATAEVTQFERTLSSVEFLVKQKEKSVVEYMGSLKKNINSLTKVIPGP